VLVGLGSGAIAFLLYGLVTQGWMMYVVILCNLLAFAAGPALQGILSTSSSAGEQGELMGSLQSIGSLGLVLMPLLGSGILGAVSHLAPSDWRVGATFFVCAALQALALSSAWRHFHARGQA
jgi:DHA1 family tetracycline resistance protein-like MFS transporter